MTHNEILAYAAGIIDGEGSIKIWESKMNPKLRGQFNLRVNVTSTDKCLIDWLAQKFGGSSSEMRSPSRTKFVKRKLGYIWECSRPNILTFLEGIYPYLVIKKDRCKIAIEFRKTFAKRERNLSIETREIRSKICMQMSHFNSRGS
jgi:hypothetical protein